MGEHEGWAQPNGLLPNGLLPNEAESVIRFLDLERWSKAEERTAELIACIQPNQPSEERRNAVVDYVQRLIVKCFPCQVFTFGSVPLKTYLPDGDIDLTAFSEDQNLKDSWATLVRDILENEEMNENAEFRVKEVQYIQAEVKIIKCLVENIVVDISFNQLGGLCTLCFLDQVDHLINQNHLFKRSVILIKAWCYYESRILGAHHGLISTYALETLVLYIFHVFNNSFAGPLEVLYRFLEFFSRFDWDNFCVSLRGPVPINSLPDVTAEPPRKDSGDLLLSKFFDACSSVYAVFPGGQDNQGQPFVSKHFNVIDPLRINNNLGRSVSKGNFFRIRSAFSFGAKRLARLLDCPKEDLYFEVNQFFMNTWDRHGHGHRPDAPRTDLSHLKLSDLDQLHGSESLGNNLSTQKLNDNSVQEPQVERTRVSRGVSSRRGNYPSEITSRTSNVSTVSRNQNQKPSSNLNSSRIPDQIVREISSNQGAHIDKGQRSSKPDHLVNEIQGSCHFVRSCSSPELTDTYCEVSYRGRRNRAAESGKSQIASARLDNPRRKNLGSEILMSQSTRSSVDDPSPVRHTSSHQSVDVAADSNSSSNSYPDDSGLRVMGEEPVPVMGTQGMHQEEQDLVNMMASSMVHGFNGQVHMPVNLVSPHLSLPVSPSILASMGYAQRNLSGMVSANIPLIEHPWGANMQFPQGMVSSPMAHYFPGMGLSPNPEDLIEPGNEKFGTVEMNPGEADDFWHEQDGGSTGGLELDNGSFEIHQSDDKQVSTSAGFNPSCRVGASGSSWRVKQKFTKDSRGSMREDHVDAFEYQDKRGSEIYLDDRTASSSFSPAARSSSLRSKTSSESSWDGSSTKVSKSSKEKRGRKTTSSSGSSTVYGKGTSVSEHVSSQADDDGRDWNSPSTMGTEIAERSTGPQSVAHFHVPRHQISGLELAQTSVSDSPIPIAPMLLGPGSRQRAMDNSGVVPFAFYPTGPPVPFFTVLRLPVYNFPTETGTSDASTSNFSGEEGLDGNNSVQNFESSGGLDQSEVLGIPSSIRRDASVQSPEEHKSDILNSDFTSHWHNLQFGRFCQNPRYHRPLVYPPPVVVPPAYLQGRFPWDSPGRPLSANMNLFTQFMSYDPRFVPAASLQSVSNRPASVYQRYVDEMPRYHSGTGTYLPNPKVSVRDRHSRRGNYNYDRSDHHGNREGNWNINSNARAARRNHSRSQPEKPSSRLDRLPASETRVDRPWGSYRSDSFPSYQAQNGPLRSNSTHSGSANVSYGMYPLPAANPNGVSSNGPTVPPVVMLYSYDHTANYGSTAEQLEFGSFGPVDFSGMNEVSQLSERSQSSRAHEEQRFHGNSARRSSPDQSSSPHLQRRV
ncbi:hypothetical protein L1049_012899 [Liquidambar formosana]|uniref:Polymerase nucleotidyl transferase domain-containing protein n=1 Tax=Liquidambar formosana TaxID=63359 RepID=A0AAP0WWJ4_LIQFO